MLGRVDVFELQGWFLIGVSALLLGVKAFAFISAVGFTAEHYDAGNKLTKPAWVAILGIGLAAAVLLGSSPIGLINLAFTVAAFVYLADVRPALSGLTRR